ncbi:Enoyl-CoA hydratase [Pseudomonas chlororaphis subsp. aureofaciens]|uniref:enoyl-CoA hydratase n=1 Tax=Pseudomonas chlororaphis TaxID=587753 RepID=UPI000F5752E2|nr:enoyl-CoA hydratase [Pseudomonas chlororaphis]AZD86944.1 Enoyl-CoA hydratase [Pseudomonas chlororaphis subsp. aureofaciens]
MPEHNDKNPEPVVLYEVREGVALVTLNRPEYNNAQNSRMTYALDAAFRLACDDDGVKVIVLRGAGKHFSSGHDIGTPGRDVDQSFERVSLWYDHIGKSGGEFLYAREQEVYLGMCRRWREMPKPTIAMVQGACIAGGLMLAWVCDLIIASDDAYFADPVVRMGIPGVEYFAHVHELNARIAKEFLFLGERMPAARALQVGMLNRVVPRAELELETLDIAGRIAQMPRLGLQLSKQAVNNAEDLMGKRSSMDMAFGLHHFAHAHNELVSGDRLGGYDARAMARSQRGEGA